MGSQLTDWKGLGREEERMRGWMDEMGGGREGGRKGERDGCFMDTWMDGGMMLGYMDG